MAESVFTITAIAFFYLKGNGRVVITNKTLEEKQ